MECVTQFEQLLFPPFTDLLQRDVQGKLKQQWRRPACACAQSDQRLPYSLVGKYHI